MKSAATALLACLALGLGSGAFADEAAGTGDLGSLPGYGAHIAEKLSFARVGGTASASARVRGDTATGPLRNSNACKMRCQ